MQKKRAWKAILAYTCAWAWTIRNSLSKTNKQTKILITYINCFYFLLGLGTSTLATLLKVALRGAQRLYVLVLYINRIQK